MIETVSQNPWVYFIGILSAIIVIKNAWIDVAIPIAKFFGIEIHSKQSKELKELKEEINEKFDNLNEKFDSYEQHRKEEKELSLLLLQGVTATLHSLKEMGANGPVTIAINKLDEFKNQKAVG